MSNSTETKEIHPNRSSRLLIYLIAVNTALFVASNAAGAKMISVFGDLTASATVFSYALTFLFTDTIAEVYGRKAANLAVRIAFLGGIISVGLYSLAIVAPSASFWPHQEAFQTVLGHAPRILLGGFTAYFVSQHMDVWLFHFFKGLTKGRYLWFRNNASTAISQLVDTCIFMTVAFYGVFPITEAILGQYAIKLLIAALDTPIVYFAVAYCRRSLVADEAPTVVEGSTS